LERDGFWCAPTPYLTFDKALLAFTDLSAKLEDKLVAGQPGKVIEVGPHQFVCGR